MNEKVRKILLVISVAVLIFSSLQLLQIYLEYKNMREDVEELREQVTETQEIPDDQEEEESFLIINWEALQKVNDDVIGWIQIPDTEISYPILKGSTNDTYLRTNISMKYSVGGSIFVEATNAGDFSDMNTIIYGHNMKDGTMFSHLHKYTENDEFYAEHQYVYIYTPDGLVSTYHIEVAHVIDATSELYTVTIQDEDRYRNMLSEENVLNTSIEDLTLDNLLMLSTCHDTSVSETARTVVHAVLEEEGLDPTVAKPQ